MLSIRIDDQGSFEIEDDCQDSTPTPRIHTQGEGRIDEVDPCVDAEPVSVREDVDPCVDAEPVSVREDVDPWADAEHVSVRELEIVGDSGTDTAPEAQQPDSKLTDIRRMVSEHSTSFAPAPRASTPDLDVLNLTGGLYEASWAASTRVPLARRRRSWGWLGVVIASGVVVWAAMRPSPPSAASAPAPEPTTSVARDESRPEDHRSQSVAPRATGALAGSASSRMGATGRAVSPARGAAPPMSMGKATKPDPATKAEASAESSAATPEPAASEKEEGPPFDKAAAIAAIDGGAQAAASCKRPDDPSGSARVAVTFASSGHVTSATVVSPPFGGTTTGSCIAGAFTGIVVPQFGGEPVKVFRTIEIR